MSLTHRVLAVLIQAEAPLGASSIMAKSGLNRNSLHNTLTRLSQSDRITKLAHGMYAMTAEQRAKVAYLTPSAAAPHPKFGLGISAADLSRRVRFLTEIGQRPAFLGHALLSDIINDYRRALNRVTGQEDAE